MRYFCWSCVALAKQGQNQKPAVIGGFLAKLNVIIKVMSKKGFAPLIVIGIIALLVIAGAVGYFAWKRSSVPLAAAPVSGVSTQFTGTIQAANDESGSDGPISIEVNGKWIVIGGGLQAPNTQMGSVTGLDFSNIQNNLGKSVAVFAGFNSPTDQNNLTLFGNNNYYVKLAQAANSTTPTSSLSAPSAFQLQFKGFDLHLYASDQKISQVNGGFCGGDAGSVIYDGTYQIVAQKNGQQVTTISIGQQEFIAGTPHDGLHTVTYTPTGDQFIIINEYGSCNGDYSSFYTLNSKNQLVSVPFIGNGTSTIWVDGGFSDANAKTDGTFCGYSNAVGYYFCDSYQYKNYSFVQTDSWVTQEPNSTTTNDVQRAERYLFELGDSSEIKSYVPSDAQYVDEIDEIQTSTLPYTFQVDFTNPNVDDYKYIFTVAKAANGFQATLPPVSVGSTMGCTLLPYTGTTPLSQVQYYSPGEQDVRGGMVCKVDINPQLPAFTLSFAGQADNTLGNITITEGTDEKVIQTIPNTTSYDATLTKAENTIVPVDANFDGYKDLPILNQCGATGNCTYAFYLYDPVTNQFVENSFLSNLGSPSFDAGKKQLTTEWNSSYADWEADTYQYQSGQYILMQKIISASNGQNNTVMQQRFQLQNGKMTLINSTTTSGSGY